jgi:aldose 1-epimerase
MSDTHVHGTAKIHAWRREPALTLEAGPTAVTFLPDLGMLGVSLRHGDREVLATARNLVTYRHGHVTGLPLLAPWANRLSRRRYRAAGLDVDLTGLELHVDGNGLPIHGTMTARPGWEIVRLRCDDERASAEAQFDYGSEDLLAAFPFPHTLTMETTVTAGALRVVTTLTPTGSRSVPVSFGYHPYLSLAGAPRGVWMLGLPARRQAELDARGIPTGRGHDEPAERAPLGSRTFDDHYALGTDRRFSIEGADMHLVVELGESYPHAQLYAPARRPFICVEPMTAPVDALVSGDHPAVAPGSRFRAEFTITIGTYPRG